MKKVLIVIDMQNDFIDCSLGTKEAQAIVPNVKKKIEEYKKITEPQVPEERNEKESGNGEDKGTRKAKKTNKETDKGNKTV